VCGRPDLLGQPGELEAGVTALVAASFDAAAHRTDALLQHDIAIDETVAQREQHRGADGRMAGKRQLARRREDPRPRPVSGVVRRQHEYRLRQVELARHRLHRLGREAVGLEHHGERVAGEASVGEHVQREEGSAHGSRGLRGPHPCSRGNGPLTRKLSGLSPRWQIFHACT
jgi:hypothetical protein